MESVFRWFIRKDIQKQADWWIRKDELSDMKYDKPLSKLILEELNGSDDKDNQIQYNKILEMLLPSSMLTGESFRNTKTNITDIASSGNVLKKKKLSDIANDFTSRLQSQIPSYSSRGRSMKEVIEKYDPTNNVDKGDLNFIDKLYKIQVYFVCNGLLRNKRISNHLYKVIQSMEDATKDIAQDYDMKKMYFEALMNYIVVKCVDDGVESDTKTLSFDPK